MSKNKRILKKNKNFIGLFKITLFLAILFLCLLGAHNLLRRKGYVERMDEFYSQEGNFDVLFFGSSHVSHQIFPIELWDKHGIVSYNLGNSSEHVPATYYNLLLALQYTKPKLVVVDTYLEYGEKYSKKDTLHSVLDGYPISQLKYEAIEDLLGKDNLLENEIEFLFPFSNYHSRWNEINENDFVLKDTYVKGALQLLRIASPKRQKKNPDEVATYDGEESVGMEYLRKIIEYCQNNDIGILLTYNPFPADDSLIGRSKYIQKIAEGYNVKYINFLDLDVVDYNIDCSDEASHLNVSGSRKITEYIGDYIVENYNIPDQRGVDQYASWGNDYDEYIDYKIKTLKEQRENLNIFLLLLYNEKDIKYEIEISDKVNLEKKKTLNALLENLDNNYKVNGDAFKNKNEKTAKITIWDNRNNEKLDEIWF